MRYLKTVVILLIITGALVAAGLIYRHIRGSSASSAQQGGYTTETSSLEDQIAADSYDGGSASSEEGSKKISSFYNPDGYNQSDAEREDVDDQSSGDSEDPDSGAGEGSGGETDTEADNEGDSSDRDSEGQGDASSEDSSSENGDADKKVKKIVCVGDSITRGDGVKDKSKHSYPARLQELLGDKYEVINLGVDGRCLLKNGDYPYTDTGSYEDSIDENADIYIIMLGTNDTGLSVFSQGQFRKEYNEFIKTYINLPSRPRIILGLPPKAHTLPGESEPYFDIDNNVLTSEVIPIIKDCAAKNSLSTVNLYSLTESHPEWYKEGIHPNEEGYLRIAELISKEF